MSSRCRAARWSRCWAIPACPPPTVNCRSRFPRGRRHFRSRSRSPPLPPPIKSRSRCGCSVSTDNGATWAIAGRVEPKQSSFTFRAPRDGEYWFVIRTVDRQGHLKPENGRTPELRVVVDTLPPRLDLQVSRNAAGNIVAHWLAVDPLLKADTLKIEYQVAGDAIWHPVQFDLPHDDPSRSTATGDVAWRPAGMGKTVVRAEIRDRAGNTAVTQATLGDGHSGDRRPGGSVRRLARCRRVRCRQSGRHRLRPSPANATI